MSARKFLGVAVLCAAAMSFATASYAQDPVKIRFILNWKYQGPQAWFFLAQDKGYFKAEGLDVQMDQGEGSGAAVTRVASRAYDIGFGDINALTVFAAKNPNESPKAVFMIYGVSPFSIYSMKDKNITSPKQLEGKTLGAPVDDAPFKLFPAFAKATGIDPKKITWKHMQPSLREQMLVRGEVDAVSGYINTVWFSLRKIYKDPGEKVTRMRYSDFGLDLYSNAIIVSKEFIEKNPKAVAGFLRAISKGFQDVLANPNMGVEAALKRQPLLDREIELENLLATVNVEILSPESEKIGIGDVDDARLKKGIDVVVDAYDLQRTPAPGEVFTREFMPPRDIRNVHELKPQTN
ncbi:MAG TPA: ABC transporter substrate-binding protein [Pseudolabrys sp.]|jgi:NitT/TauT family transport system substrate-binding protein|nr:ABC transporter substrate-binding protein [Pseudolabrys sp.]